MNLTFRKLNKLLNVESKTKFSIDGLLKGTVTEQTSIGKENIFEIVNWKVVCNSRIYHKDLSTGRN